MRRREAFDRYHQAHSRAALDRLRKDIRQASCEEPSRERFITGLIVGITGGFMLAVLFGIVISRSAGAP